MSQQNVELHHRANDAFNRRDLDAFIGLTDAEVEFTSRNLELEGGGPHRGHEGVRTWWENLLAISPDFTGEVEEVRDLGEVTVARVRTHGHGIASDAPMEETVWQVVEWRRGKVIWSRNVPSEADALEAAGLRE